MSVHTLHAAHVVQGDHRGWKLHARWFSAFTGADEGWVCYVTGPGSSHQLNIGRWDSSDQALQNARDFVDRRLAASIPSAPKRHLVLSGPVRLAA